MPYQSADVEAIMNDLAELALLLTDEPLLFSQWESQFILSCEARREAGREFSEKQLRKIEELAEKHLDPTYENDGIDEID